MNSNRSIYLVFTQRHVHYALTFMLLGSFGFLISRKMSSERSTSKMNKTLAMEASSLLSTVPLNGWPSHRFFAIIPITFTLHRRDQTSAPSTHTAYLTEWSSPHISIYHNCTHKHELRGGAATSMAHACSFSPPRTSCAQ